MRLFFAALVAFSSVAAGQTTNLFSAHPIDQGEFGGAVCQGPDITGDGRPDLVIGAKGEAVGPVNIAGRVTIHSPVNGAIVRTLTSPNDEVWGYFGSAVATVPDITGDGTPDIAVGAPNEINIGTPTQGKGRVYLFNGATGALVRTIGSPSGDKGSGFGAALAGLGDINNDGRGDLLVGAPRERISNAYAGKVYLFSGATGTLIRAFSRANPSTYDYFGISISAVPDTTGDGRPDIAIGAPGVENNGNINDAGVAYLYNGATGAFVRSMCSTNPIGSGNFGASVSGVPDATGDGRGDVIVGAPGETVNQTVKAGRAYLFDGATKFPVRSFAPGNSEYYGQFGTTVAGMPDVTGDGRGDLAIAATMFDSGGIEDSGRVYLYSGATGAFVRSVWSTAPAQFGYFGYALAGIADVNANNKGELLVGAPRENTNFPTSGRAYLFRN